MMRKLALAMAAVGLLGATSLTPVLAASADAGIASDLSSVSMSKKRMMLNRKVRMNQRKMMRNQRRILRNQRKMMRNRMSEVAGSDLSAASRKKTTKPKKAMKTTAIVFRVAA